MQQDKQHERGQKGLAIGVACLAAGISLAFGYAKRWSGPPASLRAAALDAELGSLGLFFGALGALALAALGWVLCFRRKRPLGLPEWVPVLLVIALVARSGMLMARLPAARAAGAVDFEVELIGQQFEWLVRYPGADGKLGRVGAEFVHAQLNPAGLDPADADAADDVLRRQLLRLPLGQNCVLHLRSLDVLHSFNVESLRLRLEVLPGYPRQLQLVPGELGDFQLSCAALCGLGHYRMTGKLEVTERAELDRWLATQETWF